MLKDCEVCSNPFKVKPSHAPIRFCCGRVCQNIRASRKGCEDRSCPVCGKVFNAQKASSRQHCSAKCAHKSGSLRPPKETLEDLYCTQGKSTRIIATQFGVDKISVCRWLAMYGIPTRPKGNGLANRGVLAPTREEIYNSIRVLHESYDVLAARYGVDRTAILHWLRKYDIKPPTIWETRRKTSHFRYPDYDELVEFYSQQGMSTTSIGEMFKVSGPTIASLLSKFNIPIRLSGWCDGKRFIGSDGHELKSTYELRVCEWLTTHGISHEYEPQLSFKKNSYADFRIGNIYIEIWGVTNSDTYACRKTRKQELYRLHNISLIELSPHHFDNRNIWLRKLDQFFISRQPLFEQLELDAP